MPCDNLEHEFTARKQLFTQKSRAVENMPPTKAALEQHIKRATFQANIWCKALEPDPQLPSPADWGWVKEDLGWQPLWTTLPEASQSCYELIHCGCKKGCTNRCKCKKSALKTKGWKSDFCVYCMWGVCVTYWPMKPIWHVLYLLLNILKQFDND